MFKLIRCLLGFCSCKAEAKRKTDEYAKAFQAHVTRKEADSKLSKKYASAPTTQDRRRIEVDIDYEFPDRPVKPSRDATFCAGQSHAMPSYDYSSSSSSSSSYDSCSSSSSSSSSDSGGSCGGGD